MNPQSSETATGIPGAARGARRPHPVECGDAVKRLEKARRFERSSRPVTVDARLVLGKQMDLLQSPSFTGPLPLPPGVEERAKRPSPDWPGDKTVWNFHLTDHDVLIENAGCSNSFGIFGAPGTGKTHLMRKLLRDLVDYAPDRPEKRFGGLILDPKGSMVDDIQAMLATHPRRDDLVIIDGSADQSPVNVISCSMPTRELARTLVLAAQSSGVNAREPFWFIAWENLFGAAMTLLEYHDSELTVGRIVESIMNTDPDGQREIEGIARQLSEQAETVAATCSARMSGRSAREIELDIHQAAAEISSFYRAKQDYISTIEAFIINAYGAFRSRRCAAFSPDPWTFTNGAERNLYDSILEDGKIVVVSLPPSEPGLAKTLCTLIKCLFQQAVMSRKRRYRDLELNKWDRVVFIACDEYSEIASEVPGQPLGDGRFFALARENGCLGILATQSVHVLENSSLRESWRSVFSNFAAKIFMGASDVETARQASELAGKLDWQVRNYTVSHSREGFSISEQKDLRERDQIPTYLLTQSLQLGQGIVIGSLNGRAGRPGVRVIQVGS